MKTVILLAAVLGAAVAVPADTYNPEYDNFNLEEILGSDRLLLNYGKCLMNKGPCTSEGADIRKKIPEALKNDCAKCTPKQRELIRDFGRAMAAKHPEVWKGIIKEHDPKGEFQENFKKFFGSSK